jgi:hypothetical protein
MLCFAHLPPRVGIVLLGTVLLSGCAGSLTGPDANFAKPGPAGHTRFVGLPSGDGESVVVVEEPNKGAPANEDR